MKRFKVRDLMIDILPPEREAPELEELCWRFTCYHYRTPYCYPHYLTPYCYPHYLTPCHRYISPCIPYRTCFNYITPDCYRYISPFPCPANTELVACPGDSRLEIEQPIDPRELGILREQLQVALEQVEAAEKRVTEKMAPQTPEEVELLRGKLKEAMDELDTLAKGMQEG
jgi:hypothetical protein